MQRMFRSAQLKLTAWYLLILVIISVLFSVVIYQLNYSDTSARLQNLQTSLLEGADPAERIYLRALFASPDDPMDFELRNASGQMVLSLIYVNIIIIGASGVGAYFLARRTLRPLEQAHEAQSRFTSDASHELRTPLAAMKTELEVALNDPSLSISESREILESNLEEVEKLTKLSEMLLHLARLDHSKLERESVNLSEVAEAAVKSFGKKVTPRISLHLRHHLPVTGNGPALTELITILIDNAVKYSPPDSTITLKTFEKRGYAHVSIHNTGTPIPADAIPKLFERFFRADTARTQGSKNGYGLGLSIAKKIADVHHGELSVRSGDDGTTFTYAMLSKRRAAAAQPSE